MENRVEEYKKQYKPETIELIVRINWCWDRKRSGFSLVDNYYEAHARFDRAFDVRKGELIDVNINEWLRWLAPKKRFGFKYGFRFKIGKIYRVLVREHISNNSDENKNFRDYYLEQVLPLKCSKNIFEEQTVRPSKNKKEEDSEPVVVRNEFGEFRLNRKYHEFEGRINYLEEKCQICLETKEREDIAEIQLKKLGEIYNDVPNWDQKIKKYASQELLQLANEWLEDGNDNEIEEEQFIQRISMESITIYENGAVELMLYGDNMFTDHSIMIDIDEHGNFTGADIVG